VFKPIGIPTVEAFILFDKNKMNKKIDIFIAKIRFSFLS